MEIVNVLNLMNLTNSVFQEINRLENLKKLIEDFDITRLTEFIPEFLKVLNNVPIDNLLKK